MGKAKESITCHRITCNMLAKRSLRDPTTPGSTPALASSTYMSQSLNNQICNINLLMVAYHGMAHHLSKDISLGLAQTGRDRLLSGWAGGLDIMGSAHGS